MEMLSNVGSCCCWHSQVKIFKVVVLVVTPKTEHEDAVDASKKIAVTEPEEKVAISNRQTKFDEMKRETLAMDGDARNETQEGSTSQEML